MRGQPFEFSGRHYSARPTDFGLPPPPVQQPRPPVWVVGALVEGRDRQPSLQRAARWDGLLPQFIDSDRREKATDPDRLSGLVDRVRTLREDAGLLWQGYDVVLEADSTGEWMVMASTDASAWAGAGVTWWVESWWSLPRGPVGLEELRRRIQAGPPGERKG
jgi:hypothetical protein